MRMLAKTSDNGSLNPSQQARDEGTANNDSDAQNIKECPFVRYGCLGCIMSQPAGHCLCGNDFGDEYCQRDRKLNTRATDECLRKGCISATYVENHTLVCTHIATKCECIDRLGNVLGDLHRTRALIEVIDADKANESLRIYALLKPRRHHSGAIITEELCPS